MPCEVQDELARREDVRVEWLWKVVSFYFSICYFFYQFIIVLLSELVYCSLNGFNL